MTSEDTVQDAVQPPRILGVVVLIVYGAFLAWLLFWLFWDPSRLKPLFKEDVPFWSFILLMPSIPFLALEFIADQATRNKLSEMLRPVPNPDAVAAKAILAFFDLVYTLPLLFTSSGCSRKEALVRADWTPRKAWRWAFLPSMILTVTATLALTAYLPGSSGCGINTTLWSGMAVNIISDYLALFVIRGWLDRDGPGPLDPDREGLLEALFFAVFAGLLLVISFTGLRLISFMMIDVLFDQCHAFGGSAPIEVANNASSLGIWDTAVVKDMWTKVWVLHRPGVFAASIVHLWLPGFAILAYMLRVLNRWLRKRERYDTFVREYLGEHPVLTLGLFAGILAFGLTKLIFNIPGVLAACGLAH